MAPVPLSSEPSTPAQLPTTPASPLPASSPVGSFAPLAAGVVPILYLHRVEAPPPEWPTWTAQRRARFLAYDVIPAAFAAQLDWLQAHGYTTILPRDLAAHWSRGRPLPPRPVILTFDDGSASWMTTVLPLLRQHGMIGEFYLTLDAISAHRITWADVRALAAAGMGIGAHDVHHVQLAGLPAPEKPAPASRMWTEVNQARIVIGREIGTPPDSMAYVGGGFDPQLESLVARAGYTTARSIRRGIDQTMGHRFELRVVAIGEHDDVVDSFTGELVPGLPAFAAKIAGKPVPPRPRPR